ncbi:MAG: hypothetical protein ACTMIH_10535, partial [Microbacterium gubbeenense]
DQAGDQKRSAAAVDALVRSGVLAKAGSDDRFVISDVIERMLSIDRLHELHAWLKEQNSPDAVRPAASDDIDEEDGE